VRITWVETDDLSADKGHGVVFTLAGDDPTREREPRPSEVVAVILGFAWMQPAAEAVDVEIRRPGGEFDDGFLTDARSTIERFVLDRGSSGVMPRPLSPTLRLITNA
jgi:hypothetical protein